MGRRSADRIKVQKKNVSFILKNFLQSKAKVASSSFDGVSILASPHRLSILLQPSCFEQGYRQVSVKLVLELRKHHALVNTLAVDLSWGRALKDGEFVLQPCLSLRQGTEAFQIANHGCQRSFVNIFRRALVSSCLVSCLVKRLPPDF